MEANKSDGVRRVQVIRRKNNCGTWKLTSGNSQTKQRNAKLKGLLSNYI